MKFYTLLFILLSFINVSCRDQLSPVGFSEVNNMQVFGEGVVAPPTLVSAVPVAPLTNTSVTPGVILGANNGEGYSGPSFKFPFFSNIQRNEAYYINDIGYIFNECLGASVGSKNDGYKTVVSSVLEQIYGAESYWADGEDTWMNLDQLIEEFVPGESRDFSMASALDYRPYLYEHVSYYKEGTSRLRPLDSIGSLGFYFKKNSKSDVKLYLPVNMEDMPMYLMVDSIGDIPDEYKDSFSIKSVHNGFYLFKKGFDEDDFLKLPVYSYNMDTETYSDAAAEVLINMVDLRSCMKSKAFDLSVGSIDEVKAPLGANLNRHGYEYIDHTAWYTQEVKGLNLSSVEFKDSRKEIDFNLKLLDNNLLILDLISIGETHDECPYTYYGNIQLAQESFSKNLNDDQDSVFGFLYLFDRASKNDEDSKIVSIKNGDKSIECLQKINAGYFQSDTGTNENRDVKIGLFSDTNDEGSFQELHNIYFNKNEIKIPETERMLLSPMCAPIVDWASNSWDTQFSDISYSLLEERSALLVSDFKKRKEISKKLFDSYIKNNKALDAGVFNKCLFAVENKQVLLNQIYDDFIALTNEHLLGLSEEEDIPELEAVVRAFNHLSEEFPFFFKLVGHDWVDQDSNLIAGVQDGDHSVFGNIFKLPPSKWLMIWTHEMIHLIDEQRHISDQLKFETVKWTGMAPNSCLQSALVEASLESTFWSEFRAWKKTFSIYEKLKNKSGLEVSFIESAKLEFDESKSLDINVHQFLMLENNEDTSYVDFEVLKKNSNFSKELISHNLMEENIDLHELSFINHFNSDLLDKYKVQFDRTLVNVLECKE